MARSATDHSGLFLSHSLAWKESRDDLYYRIRIESQTVGRIGLSSGESPLVNCRGSFRFRKKVRLKHDTASDRDSALR